MNEAELRREVCRVGHSLHTRGYAHGSAGNISVRLADGFLITPTDASLGELEADALAKVDADGASVCGPRPSKTLRLHRRIYATVPEAGCIIHTHSRHLVATSLLESGPRDDFLPPITPYFVMKVGHVPLLAYRRPGDPVVADEVEAAIGRAAGRGTPIRAVMLARLGPTVWHETPALVMAALEELEETARLWRTCWPRPEPLAPEAIEELRAHFGARW